MTDIFDSLTATAANDGVHVMLEELAQSLRERHRWHALFDLRREWRRFGRKLAGCV